MIDMDDDVAPGEVRWAEGKLSFLLGIGVDEAARAMARYADSCDRSLIDIALEILSWPNDAPRRAQEEGRSINVPLPLA